MKRVLLTVALCVAASVSFAQKKAVNEAQSIAKGTTPDFSEARTLIKGALENPETKDDAKLGMLPVLSRINSSATKELNKSWANNRTSLLCMRHWVVFCHTLRKHMS
mgnify:CR=1 FL=1